MSSIMNITYNEWLINQKRLPDPNSSEYAAFWQFHKEVCINGANMYGVYIPGFLYWHLNIWQTDIDYIDDKGRIKSEYRNPPLRDNEWLICNEIERAQRERKGLIILGIRRFGKSTIESSFIGYGATFDENSENIVAYLSEDDAQVLTKAISQGLMRVPFAFRWQFVKQEWNKEVLLGLRKKDNKAYIFSTIWFRNLKKGRDVQNLAGPKIRRLVIDEIGKGNWVAAYEAALPAFSTPFGLNAVPLLTGTGGSMDTIHDALKVMNNPSSFNLLEYEDENTGKKRGYFISNKYRLEAKDPSNLGDFLRDVQKMELSDKQYNQLKKVSIMVSNEEKAAKIKQEQLEKIKESGDVELYNMHRMYYPDTPDEIFLNLNVNNIYSSIADEVLDQIKRLEASSWKGAAVELYEDEYGKVKHRFSSKPIINNYPLRKTDVKDGAVCIVEFPIVDDPPFGLYVAGVDSLRFGSAAYSDSLGAVYIFKRGHDIYSDKLQNCFVAWYVARTDDKTIWDEQARMLIKMYNAYTLVENDEYSFIQYMISKDEGFRIADQPKWIREIAPTTRIDRDKGISRANKDVREYLHTMLRKYLQEPIYVEKDENGNITRKVLGVRRVMDIGLLKEILHFNEEDNFDREVASSLALALAAHLDPIVGRIGEEANDFVKAYHKQIEKEVRQKMSLLRKSTSLFDKELENRSMPFFR